MPYPKNSELKRFFLRIQAKKGSKVAAVALAKKVLCILHHLLTNHEIYQESECKNLRKKTLVPPSPIEMPMQEMIDYIVRAGYVVTKRDRGGQSGWFILHGFSCETAAAARIVAKGLLMTQMSQNPLESFLKILNEVWADRQEDQSNKKAKLTAHYLEKVSRKLGRRFEYPWSFIALLMLFM